MNARFEPPSIKQRGQVAGAMGMAYAQRPTTGEHAGTFACPRCHSTIRFTVFANGLSYGQCAATGCIRWTR